MGRYLATCILIMTSISCADLAEEETEESSITESYSSHQDFSRLENTYWSLCGTNLYSKDVLYEIHIQADQGYEKRVTYFSASDGNCNMESSYYQEIVTGSFDQIEDSNYSGFQVRWNIEDYQFLVLNQDLALQLDELWTYGDVPDGSDNLYLMKAFCENTTFVLNRAQSILDKNCQFARSDYDFFEYSVHNERFYLSEDSATVTFTDYTFPVSILESYSFSDIRDGQIAYPSDNMALTSIDSFSSYPQKQKYFEASEALAYLQGQWTICVDGNKSYLTFTNNTYIQETIVYSNSYCAEGFEYGFSQVHSGTIRLELLSEEFPGKFAIDWIIEDFSMSARSSIMLDLFNATGPYAGEDPLCTDVNFTLDSYSSLVGRNCDLQGDGYSIFAKANLFDALVVTEGNWIDSDYDASGGETEESRKTKILWNAVWDRVE